MPLAVVESLIAQLFSALSRFPKEKPISATPVAGIKIFPDRISKISVSRMNG
jgi:hypothetical protein